MAPGAQQRGVWRSLWHSLMENIVESWRTPFWHLEGVVVPWNASTRGYFGMPHIYYPFLRLFVCFIICNRSKNPFNLHIKCEVSIVRIFLFFRWGNGYRHIQFPKVNQWWNLYLNTCLPNSRAQALKNHVIFPENAGVLIFKAVITHLYPRVSEFLPIVLPKIGKYKRLVRLVQLKTNCSYFITLPLILSLNIESIS